MAINSFRSWKSLVLLMVVLFSASVARAEIEIGGIVFDDNAFADRVLSTDYTGDLTGCTGNTPLTVEQAIAGNNLNTWIDYGYHDMEPGPNGDYNSLAPPFQYVELAFTDNVVVNGAGNDLVVFQIGTPNSVRVGLDKASIQAPYYPGSSTVVSDPVAMPINHSNDCIQVTVAYIDLSDLGVADGESVYRVFLTSPLMENGDVAWYNPAYPQLGVPELAGVAALNSSPKGNYSPEVDAGNDFIISLPNNVASLTGHVLDDGLPSETLVASWSQVSGPDTAIFSDEQSPTSQASFPQVGVYTFELAASDGELVGSDTVSITVTDVDPVEPSIPLNLQGETHSNTGVSLTWDASSDNVSVRHYNIYRNDEFLTATADLFYTDYAVDAGSTYWYVIEAEDPAGNLSLQSVSVLVTLSEALLAVQISSGADDAEEFVDGGVDRSGGDLELVEDGRRGSQLVGLRFAGVNLPVGVEIVRAWLEFEADETNAEETNLIIEGLADDSPVAFSATDFDISNRSRTMSYVDWNSLPEWGSVNQRHQTTDIAPIIQELVDRAGWQSGNAMGFVISGSGKRVAESYNGERTAAPRLLIEYILGPPVNQAPLVDAGEDASLLLPAYELMLSGSAADDGLPGGVLLTTWTQLSGPGQVVFSDDTSLTPTAIFPQAGEYELQLSVLDGELESADEVIVTVFAPDATAPTTPTNVQLLAGYDGSVTASWAASDDDSGVQLYRVLRDGVEIAQTAATSYFDSGLQELAEYGYQIQAEDFSGNVSSLSAIQYVLVPAAPLPGTMFDVRIGAGVDDAEEADDGRMDLGSTDIELVDENGMGNQTVGLRFTGVGVPSGAIIVNAWLEFEADETSSTVTSLSISAMTDTNVPEFTADAFNISSRGTVGSVAWEGLPAWAAVSEKHQTPNISSLVQAVINSAGWTSGNAMGFVISGSGTRTAESYNGERAAAPLLHIEYYDAAPVNAAPIVNAGDDSFISLPDSVVPLSGTVTDDGLSGFLQLDWSVISGPAAVVFSSSGAASTDAEFSAAGVYVLQLQADDGEFVVTDSLTVTVTEPDTQAPSSPSGVNAVVTGIGSVAVMWGASTDNVSVDIYRVYRGGVYLAEVAGLEFTDIGLSDDTYFEYQVTAVDPAGNESALSNVAGVTTLSVSGDVLTFDVAVSSGSDDAEEGEDGRVDLGSSDIELVDENGMGNQLVGIRFVDVQIPAGSIIANAYLQFEADEAGSSVTNLTIMAIDDANTATFASDDYNISSRNRSGAVQWSGLPAWSVNDNHASPDIATLVQAVVNNTGWISGNAMGFVISGSGTRTAESYNGERQGAVSLHIEYYEGDPVNQAPQVNAGNDIAVSISSPVAVLSGAYADDGVSPVTLSWSQVSGPDQVVFSAPDIASPEVTFSQPGSYTLRLTGDDGEFVVSDTVVIDVAELDTLAPTEPLNLLAVASPDVSVSLEWDAATDNVGVVAYRIYRDAVMLTEVSGLQYMDSDLAAETYYEYTVTALDLAGNESLYSASETIGVTTPYLPDQLSVLDVPISSGLDDIEEGEDGRIDLGSSDLELVDENGMGNQMVGLRFTDIQLPAGSVVINAWLEFEADESGSGESLLTISILSDSDVPSFTDEAFSLSSRAAEGAVSWNGLPDWSVNQIHQTPNLAGLIQPIVSSLGWVPGNAMGFVISGSGTRTAESYNGERQGAAVLHIEYYEGEPVNQAPAVDAGIDQMVSLPDATLSLSGNIVDDGLSGALDLSWSVISAPAGVAFSNEFSAATDVTFTAVGSYELQLTANDGEFSSSDSLIVTVLEADYENPSVPQGVMVDLQSNGDVLLNWVASTDNAGVVGYWVYRDGVQVSDQPLAGGFVDVGLEIGSYEYVVSAYDYSGNQSDESEPVTVTIDSIPLVFETQVSQGDDDAEEHADGSIQLGSTDLEIVDEVGYSLQTVGVRFQDVAIPAGAEIVNAYLTFEVDENSSGVAAINISAEDDANPLVFTENAYDITNRVTLVESVLWDITDDWSVNERYSTPDLSNLIQVLVERGDWVAGGAMSFIFSGSGTRTVESYNGERRSAPTLHIEYR